ncbi:Aklanonic acid methyltransferase DauC [BD1-7 clade bacterium]|uniref:Aklanonic acid methyltransferase DauC n=1 Tax=BD1-7 clade bacterium TaxID=2029982 RepID=A0A5S9QKA7_9GAMM|nr:Aklanonic acid methyltransferase DauC [BD1-7 clade bacterium]
MKAAQKLQSYYHLLTCGFRGDTHAGRLDSFYRKQAEHYDETRQNICPDRQAFFDRVASVADYSGKTWLDVGSGTGAVLDSLSDEQIGEMNQLVLLDITPSLLEKAREKVRVRGLTNVTVLEDDACAYQLSFKADVVTFCYSLTMMPNWWRAVERAKAHLQNDGIFAITDFYVSPKVAPESRMQHGWFTREILPVIFATDHVHLSADHLPYIRDQFDAVEYCYEGLHGLSGLGFIKRPYYQLIVRPKTL